MVAEGEQCPNCHQGVLENVQRGRVRDDEIEIPVMVTTCPKCGWSTSKTL